MAPAGAHRPKVMSVCPLTRQDGSVDRRILKCSSLCSCVTSAQARALSNRFGNASPRCRMRRSSAGKRHHHRNMIVGANPLKMSKSLAFFANWPLVTIAAGVSKATEVSFSHGLFWLATMGLSSPRRGRRRPVVPRRIRQRAGRSLVRRSRILADHCALLSHPVSSSEECGTEFDGHRYENRSFQARFRPFGLPKPAPAVPRPAQSAPTAPDPRLRNARLRGLPCRLAGQASAPGAGACGACGLSRHRAEARWPG